MDVKVNNKGELIAAKEKLPKQPQGTILPVFIGKSVEQPMTREIRRMANKLKIEVIPAPDKEKDSVEWTHNLAYYIIIIIYIYNVI